jgi:enamine deaminase RidA (YjgF/YER057c/UK114 family)
MVKPQAIELPGPRPIGYAHAVRVGDLLYLSGQVGAALLPDGKLKVVDGGLVPQFELCLANVLKIVRAAGGSAESIVEMTVYVTDVRLYRGKRREIGEAWQRQMGKHYPAMTLVAVADLVEPEALVEVRAVAAVG